MKRKYRYHPHLTEEEIARVVDLYASGKSCKEVAAAVGISPSNVSRICVLHGVNRRRGGPSRAKECRLIIDGHYRRWQSLRAAARSLGYRSHESLRWEISTGRVLTWPADKFRVHPGLDAMPTPYPFKTKSKELLEAKGGRNRKEVQDGGD